MQNSFSLRQVIVDKDGRPVDFEILEANPAFEAYSGFTADEIVGRRLTEVYPGLQPERFNWVQELGEVALSGQPKTFEQYFEASRGWYQVSAYSPEPGLIAILLTDITANKLAEQRLKRQAEEVAATNQELQTFTNLVAHDFRSPMVNLKGFSQELSASLAELRQIIDDRLDCFPLPNQKRINALFDNEVTDELHFIHAAVDRLDRMVNALLELARLGRREMTYKTVDVNELVRVVLRSFDHQISQKGIQVEVGPLLVIETDYLALEQITGNLLDNAIKYLDSDRPGKISISCTVQGDEYLFAVRDNGRGMVSADCEKAFELFRRVGRPNVPGEGLGLAHVRALVRQLGGKVWCESELGVGTTVYFTVRECDSPVLKGIHRG